VSESTAQPPLAPSARLLYALLFSAGRFVPVPFVDDLLREQVALYMVQKAVLSKGKSIPRSHLVPLASPAGGACRGAWGSRSRSLSRSFSFPFGRSSRGCWGVRHFTRDVVEIVVLGRLVERAIDRGELDGAKSEATQRAECLVLRQALDAALAGTDLSILGATLRAALGPLRGVMLAGLSALRVMRRSGAEAPPAPDATLSGGTSRLERAFDRPEVRKLIEEIEQRLDGHLSRLRAESTRA
jgi:hypothetical protein